MPHHILHIGSNHTNYCLAARLKFLLITGWGCPSIIAVVQEQYKLVQATNNQALRSIQQSMQQSSWKPKSKLLGIPKGNLVLLCDHPDGYNKIQDNNQGLVMVSKHLGSNVYYIKPVNGNGPVWTVTQCDLPGQSLLRMSYKFPLTKPKARLLN